MSWKFRYKYGVSKVEVEGFVEGDVCVRNFLSKYENTESWKHQARGLCMFFKWLRLVKGLNLSPSEFLDLHLKKRGSVRIEDRLWARDLVLEFSRNNKDFKGLSGHYKYGKLFMPLKTFCDYHEVPLTSAKAIFGKFSNRKHQEPAYTIAFAKKVLSVLNQRDRAICMVMLQSGQSMSQVLNDVNSQAKYVLSEVEAGKQRIRLDFEERKGNGFAYYSFISRDAIQELRKWMPIREKWMCGDSEWLFVTDEGKRLRHGSFETGFRNLMKRHGLWKGAYTVRSHMFRKIFESEASPPDRGVSKDYVSFMIGHSRGNNLDAVGGVYDKSPSVHSDAVEREYAKLEPYINIYSGKYAFEESLSGESKALLRDLAEVLDTPEKAKIFADAVNDALRRIGSL